MFGHRVLDKTLDFIIDEKDFTGSSINVLVSGYDIVLSDLF